MAVRKDTIKRQFIEALPPVLEPGEQVLGGAYGVSGAEPLVGAGPARARRVPDLRHALLLRGAHRPPADLPERLVLDLAPKGFAWADPRDSITISDLQTDNKLWNWGKISSPTTQNLRMNFHAFWRPELKAMGDVLADRIVGPRLGSGAAGDPVPAAGRRPSELPPSAPPPAPPPAPPAPPSPPPPPVSGG